MSVCVAWRVIYFSRHLFPSCSFFNNAAAVALKLTGYSLTARSPAEGFPEMNSTSTVDYSQVCVLVSVRLRYGVRVTMRVILARQSNYT